MSASESVAADGLLADLADPGFDVAALRAKYVAERDKRLRDAAIGHGQYRSVLGDGQFAGDPWSDPDFSREPMQEEVDVVILGGGFSGLTAAVEFLKRGVDDFLIIDTAGDFGGTWYWNRYPGVQCDTEAYMYLPLLEETGYIPSQKYSDGYEILDHARRIGHHFDLYRRALFQTRLTEARWDEAARRWVVRTDRDDTVLARFLVIGFGIWNAPRIPRIEGMDTFRGKLFHTSRWDYEYTGGDDRGARMTRIADKNIGIIGTGCTALQAVPRLASDAGHLHVFQRTPALVAERNNRPTDASFTDSIEPGWWERRNRTFLELMEGLTDDDPVQDGWTVLFTAMRAIGGDGLADLTPEQIGQLAEVADFRYTNGLRERIDRLVDDPEVAERLKGWYGQWCKRPMFHDEYHPSFNRPNVSLIDTDGRGVQKMSERGVVLADGSVVELDCLIFASGYDSFGSDFRQQAQMEVYGRDGEKLFDHWSERVTTFQRTLTHGFPNALFLVQTATVGAQANIVYFCQKQAEHTAYIIAETLARGATRVEVAAEAEEAFDELAHQPGPLKEYIANCTPGNFNQLGLGGPGPLDYQYPGGQIGFLDDIKKWRDEGRLEGLTLSN
jgi:cyclohexanone monooxygenase